ncbi:MAG: DUF1427 family protein [Pseudomonadota bacterium]
MIKFVLSFLLALTIGAVARLTGVPVPAPPALIGAMLVLSMTLGYITADHRIRNQKTSASGGDGRSAGYGSGPF